MVMFRALGIFKKKVRAMRLDAISSVRAEIVPSITGSIALGGWQHEKCERNFLALQLSRSIQQQQRI